ncbi:MAG: formylglycine-generating enzyme family protein [Methylococcaceae bacterium]|nr:formylglycine-generating enzyme family protein [Methylococcaceae bacterium]
MQHKLNRRKALEEPRFRANLVVVLLLFSLAAHGWEEKLYNPKPNDDDVVLPMPCDGALALRKISIPLSGPLDDYRILLGGMDANWDFVEHTLPGFIMGSFDESNGNSYYLMGKYEITRLQYAAVINEKCPEASLKQRLPQDQVNWFDAVDFTNRYNLWLLNNAKDKLPGRGDQLGFVRLPTEIEWEYAARGGIAVSSAEFQDRKFPMTEEMSRYVWYAGTQSANGEAQLIGLLKPNPLNLYDMLGNIGEIVFEPFRLNKVSRLHGQAGSFIVRGGNFLTSKEDIRSSMREEVPYYMETGLRRNKVTGFRVVVSGSVLTSLKRSQAIQEAWPKLGTELIEPNKPQLGETALENPVEELQTIADAATDANMKRRLNNLLSVFRGSIEAQNEQRARAGLAALRLGSFLCRKSRSDIETLNGRRKVIQNVCGQPEDVKNENCEKMRSRAKEDEAALAVNLDYYADTITSNALEYSEDTLDKQMGVLSRTLTARGLSEVIPFLQRYRSHLGRFAADGRIAREDWLKQCSTAKAQ